jgi:hypothetical protein
MKPFRFLLGLAVLSLSVFFTAVETRAEVRLVDKLEVKDPSASASLLRAPKSRTAKEKSKALRRSASKACACSMVDELDGGGSCFSNCLVSWGVTREKAAGCLTVCVAAGTGNPVAIAVCAACLGTAEWIAGYCGLRCAWNSAFAPEDGPISKRRSQPRTRRSTDFVRV